MAGHEDDREVDAECRELRLEVEPAYTRKADIEHQASRGVLALGIEELLRRPVGPRRETNGAAKAIHRATKRFVVIDDVNDTLLLRPAVACERYLLCRTTFLEFIPCRRPAPDQTKV